ncbi:MAG: hypothetical protein U0694_23115 [Anaerolineae bacterium]
MKRTRMLLTCALLVALLSVTFLVRAVCNPADTGTAANDTIVCDVANPPAANVQAGAGDDIVIIDAGVVAGVDVSGGNMGAGAESGNDVLVNNGLVNGIIGDTASGNGTGSDIIVNNGIIGTIVGDTLLGTSSGSDLITNNGSVSGSVFGDGGAGGSTGNDTIINNGTVGGGIFGDDGPGTGTGSDTIINNGNIGTSIVADGGNDVVTNNGAVSMNIDAGSGADTVIINTNSATVAGTIDGGTGYDVLAFNLASTDPQVLLDAAAQIAAANPAGGTITLAGHTYTWTNFEQLTQLLFSVIRINGLMDPLAVFCALSGGIDLYVVSGTQGIFSLYVSTQTISNALAYAQTHTLDLQITASGTSSLWALRTGQVQARTSAGFSFSFTYQQYCGTLPVGDAAAYGAPGTVTQDGESLPPLSIINQPYTE